MELLPPNLKYSCPSLFSAAGLHPSLLGVYSAVCFMFIVFEGQHQNWKRGIKAEGEPKQAGLADGQCFGAVTCWDRHTSSGAASLNEGMGRNYERAKWEEAPYGHFCHPLAQHRVMIGAPL